MKLKVCGVTRASDIVSLNQLPIWAVGFNFYVRSPRLIDIDHGRYLAGLVASHIRTIGIVMDVNDIETVLTFCDYVQVYTDDLPDVIDKKRCILVRHSNDLSPLPNTQAFAHILLDAPCLKDGLLGGTGRTANQVVAKQLVKDHSLILAGGITLQNVDVLYAAIKPFAMDVASGFEVQPGIKDVKKIKVFLKKVGLYEK
ncbi:MAG: phosphoribosylanthranilate isomerase [Gammaproteobacteria bacterium]|nr:phosphoribosylanthranilate isomerase [Gammaproteobacteria bacterium]